jgi:MYXO-CTERM domain-containing protein
VSRRQLIAALVLLGAAGAASAFVRETSVARSPGSGTCLWWGQRQVTYHVNAASAAGQAPSVPACANCAPCLDAPTAADLVRTTFVKWNQATRSGDPQACTDFTLLAGTDTTQLATGNDGVNLVVFRSGWCSSTAVVPSGDPCRNTLGACAAKYNCWEHDASATIGLTTVTFNATTGQIIDADVEFHGRDFSTQPTGFWLTCAASPACTGLTPWSPPQASCTSLDVASVALHEAGHVLGLDHTCQYAAPYDACPPGSVMKPSLSTGVTLRTLSPDDVDGVCTIYPRGAATLTCAPTGATPSPGGGCGCGAGEANGALALVAAALLAARTRRRR